MSLAARCRSVAHNRGVRVGLRMGALDGKAHGGSQARPGGRDALWSYGGNLDQVSVVEVLRAG